mmetsp:Transcript_23779/g.66795  ORF Transcript_23779/g.66795 Transcript_23779/m.66795 type:complete len:234 (-) Transcript_23779:130-831(-)
MAHGRRFNSVLRWPTTSLLWTRTSPAEFVMCRQTSSTIRTSAPDGFSTRAASPLISSAARSLKLMAPPWPNLVMSIPCLQSCANSISSVKPVGTQTRVDSTSSLLSAPRFTPQRTASSSGIQEKNLVYPLSSTALHSLKPGSPTFSSRSGRDVQTVPLTKRFRYTVITPGYDGDSNSSSCRKVLPRLNLTTSFSAPAKRSMSLRIRFAVSRVLSCGFLFVPGSRTMSRARPSG